VRIRIAEVAMMTRPRFQPLVRFVSIVLVALATSAASPAGADPSRWTEAKWPFLIDQWGFGSAYQCKAGDCGIEVTLYLRAKVGFCNCTTGIAEDEEIDRVGDIGLVGWQSRARGLGAAVSVGWMKGRSRSFLVEGRDRQQRFAHAVALSNKCDAIVATVVADQPISPDIERSAMDFLGSPTVLRWAALNTGL
jgi:hypothetical protein